MKLFLSQLFLQTVWRQLTMSFWFYSRLVETISMSKFWKNTSDCENVFGLLQFVVNLVATESTLLTTENHQCHSLYADMQIIRKWHERQWFFQSNIYDGAFFAKIVDGFKSLTIFAKMLYVRCSIGF